VKIKNTVSVEEDYLIKEVGSILINSEEVAQRTLFLKCEGKIHRIKPLPNDDVFIPNKFLKLWIAKNAAVSGWLFLLFA
jgi:hypothetical protein